MQFDDLESFLDWYQEAIRERSNNPEKPLGYPHTTFSGIPKQLVAGTATFLCLIVKPGDEAPSEKDVGEVLTWGDPRYGSLGRSIMNAPLVANPDQNADITPSSADHPGLIEALDGVKIRKIACGGWMSAALAEDGSLYFWGTVAPASDRVIGPLRRLTNAQELALFELPGAEHEEPLDVVDVGVGDKHIVVVLENGQTWGIGDNRNGQLGIGDDAPEWYGEWTKTPNLEAVKSVICGPRSTFAWIAARNI